MSTVDDYGREAVAFVAKYRKAFVALVGAGVVVVGNFVGVDSSIYNAVVAVVTAAGVYSIPNA